MNAEQTAAIQALERQAEKLLEASEMANRRGQFTSGLVYLQQAQKIQDRLMQIAEGHMWKEVPK